MKQRCYNRKNDSYPKYGARGITICEDWFNDKWVFVAWAYEKLSEQGLTTANIGMGKDQYSLDRIDNDGPYAPWNCEYKGKKAQLRNTRKSVRCHAFGETKTLIEWSEDDRCAVGYKTLKTRIRRGWGIERSLTCPLNQRAKIYAPERKKVNSMKPKKFIAERYTP